jgi:hypothetical protein
MQRLSFIIISLWLLSVCASPPSQKLVKHFIYGNEGDQILSDYNLMSTAMENRELFFRAYCVRNDDFGVELFINAFILNHGDFVDKLSDFEIDELISRFKHKKIL